MEFNLGKSINSQVRSVVLLKKVLADNVQDILADAERWTEYHRAATKISQRKFRIKSIDKHFKLCYNMIKFIHIQV